MGMDEPRTCGEGLASLAHVVGTIYRLHSAR
jgi:hypothetical protein